MHNPEMSPRYPIPETYHASQTGVRIIVGALQDRAGAGYVPPSMAGWPTATCREPNMQLRQLGRTGLKTSVLSYGCGAVGGLMTKGEPADQERAFSRALDMGITYFDTASMYGNGTSEVNLGRILAKLKPKVAVGTKVRLKADEYGRIGAGIRASLEASLQRLGRDSVDLFQLHNRIGAETNGDMMSVEAVLGDVVPAMQKLRDEGKFRFFGITAIGETAALHKVVESGAFDTAQISYNALNPSPSAALPKGFPGQDYGRLMEAAQKKGMGTIGIRVLAAGALSGSEARHPLNVQVVEPIGSGADFKEDVGRARRFEPLIKEGIAANLPELAMRFAITTPALSTTLVGLANIEQLEAAYAAVMKGPLSTAELAKITAIQNGFVS